jgi:hypothetical protein
MTLPIDRQWNVYTLNDGITGEVRYIGVTVLPLKRRLGAHIYKSRSGGELNYKAMWIKSQIEKGTLPTITAIETGYGPGWEACEQKWIAYYRSINARLTNLTDGGEGAQGMICSLETRLKISIAGKGAVRSQEFKEAVSRSQGRYKKTGEAFWAKGDWFRELCLAGYKGTNTQKAPDSSVASHRQIVAMILRFLCQKALRVTVDGSWGPKSIQACKDAEKAHELPETGQPSLALLEVLSVTS